jgi:hypothetical protein
LIGLSFRPTPAGADQLVIGSAAAPIVYDPVQISRIEDGQVYFTFQSGRETHRELGQIVHMQLDGQTAFNAAEVALGAKRWAAAIDGYEHTMAETHTEWLQSFCALRLLQAANGAGQFDAAVTGYIAVAIRDPVAAPANQPALSKNPAALNQAAAQTFAAYKAIASDPTKSVQQEILLRFLIDLDQARNDGVGAADAAQRLLNLHGAGAADPGTSRVLAQGRLAMAQALITQGKFTAAVESIHANSATFTEPAQQIEALFMIAGAREGLAAAGDAAGSAPSSGAVANWQDAALAYLRVVADFKNEADNPRIPESLFHAATILQRIQDPSAAALFRQIADQYPQSVWADPARRAVRALIPSTQP